MKKNQKIERTSDAAPCFECGAAELIKSDVELTGERSGESFTVRMPGFRCSNCGFQTIDSIASAQFTRLISDAYRMKHELLTGAEILARREQLAMSQQQFADYLGVGVASVKRWELGHVQEKAMDELMRLKTDPEAARNNLKALELQVPEPYVLSSTVLNGRDVEFYVFLDQQFRTPPPLKIEPCEAFSFIESDEDEPVAA